MRIPIARLTVVGLSIIVLTGCRGGGGLAKAWPWGKKSDSEPAVASAPKSSYADSTVELPSSKAKPSTLAGTTGSDSSPSSSLASTSGSSLSSTDSLSASTTPPAYNAFTNNTPAGTGGYPSTDTTAANAYGAGAYGTTNNAYGGSYDATAGAAAYNAYGATAGSYGTSAPTTASPASYQPRYGQEYGATAAAGYDNTAAAAYGNSATTGGYSTTGTPTYGTTGYDATGYGNTAYNPATGTNVPAYGTTTPSGYGEGIQTADARNSTVPSTGATGWEYPGSTGTATTPSYGTPTGGAYPATTSAYPTTTPTTPTTPGYNTGAATQYGMPGSTGYDPGNMSDNKPSTVGQYASPYGTTAPANLTAGSSTDFAPGSTGRFNGAATTAGSPYGNTGATATLPGANYQ